MKKLLTFLVVVLIASGDGLLEATTLVGDAYNVTGSGSGFALGSGVNSGINPPGTRLTGPLAAGLRYLNTGTKATTAYTITANKLQVASAVNPGRCVLSADGANPFDFGAALGIAGAAPGNPVVYDLLISMNNASTGTQRFSFALGTIEGDATTWAFGIQFYRTNSANSFYTVEKRIDTSASGLASDLDKPVYTMAANTFGTEVAVLIRVTDAGSESVTFNSRVQVSLNGGSTWIYDTASDADLTSGWRLNGAGRIIMWDVAPSAGNVTFDNFSLNWNSGPRTWSGAGANGNWSNATNWGGGVAPANGSQLNFAGTTRVTNTNDLTGLVVPSVVFKAGGFNLYGNYFTNSGAITNSSGLNTFKGGFAWSGTNPKNWSVANGTELVLDNTSSIEVNGDHSVYGGGTLRLKGTLNIGQATTANPSFIVNEGNHIIDGGRFVSRGGYRIGSLASASGGVQTILTNAATFSLTGTASNVRVGDSANPASRGLIINNSSLTLAGGILAVPFAGGATGVVTQIGGTVSGCILSFSESGAGSGTYTVSSGGVLQPTQIRENTSTGFSSINFNNAILRTAAGANSAFFTGLNVAQIQSGGLTIDAATADIVIGQVLSGSGVLTKTGAHKVTITGANSYTGNTTVGAGTLALGTGGSIASSPTVTISDGTTLDVSALSSYALGSAQTLARESSTGVGNVSGSATFASGAQISLQLNGSTGSAGTLAFAGNITVNSTPLTINITAAPLGIGTYSLLTYTGTKTGVFNPVPTITGSGMAMGLAAAVVETSGQVSLKVYVPAHRISAGTIQVVQNDLANFTTSVTLTVANSINGMQLRDGSNRGDYTVQVGAESTNDVSTGVLLASIAENGRDNGEDSGINYCTPGISYNRTGSTAGSYFVNVAAAPGGGEYNINVAVAFFPYTNWIGGYARNSAGTANGPNDLFTGSPGLALGTHFIDNGDGTSTVNLTSLGIDSRTDGVLLVSGGNNDDDYALSGANTNGTWTIYSKDNGTNGAVFEQDPVAFVFVPKSNMAVISGRFQGDGTILMYSGTTPRFSVTNTGTGTWQLSIPGYTPKNGVLLVSPDNADSTSQDNIVSSQPGGNNWIIQSRDLPGLGLQTAPGAVCSFVFIPSPTATLVSPANFATGIATSPALTVNVTNNSSGTLSVTFVGHDAGKPFPGPDFLIPVLPDTQNYAKADGAVHAHEMWYSQTDWIIDNHFSQNIPFVIQLGDIVQNGDILSGAPNDAEWEIATNAMYPLESQSRTLLTYGIPYACAVGNHDQEPNGEIDGTTTHFNEYFGVSHCSAKPYYGGHYDTNNDSFFDFFSVGGLDFIAISFEFDRYGSAILGWAASVLATNQNRRVIFFTHYAGSDCGGTSCSLSASGQAFYDMFKSNTNFFLMLGGHVFNGAGDGEGSRSDTFNGHTVHTLVSDYQGRTAGGDGIMRLMYFSPSNNTVSIKTYSSWTDTYETDANSQFSFSYNMQLPAGPGAPATAYTNIAVNAGVTSGAQTSTVWSGLAANQTYEWYVVVTNDVGDYGASPVWQFTTSSSFTPHFAGATIDPGYQTWAAGYGITDPNADADGDGQSNYAEYLAGTNPNDAASVFRIVQGRINNGQFTLTWASSGGKRYRIQYAESPNSGFIDLVRDASEEIDPSAAGVSSRQSFTDSAAATNVMRYYRVKIIQ
jgi:autotransporter-associated beta strand protein